MCPVYLHHHVILIFELNTYDFIEFSPACRRSPLTLRGSLARTHASPSMHSRARRCVYASQKSQTSHPFEGAGTRGETSSGAREIARPGDARSKPVLAPRAQWSCVATQARLYVAAAWIRLTATLIYSYRCLSRAAVRSLARARRDRRKILASRARTTQ